MNTMIWNVILQTGTSTFEEGAASFFFRAECRHRHQVSDI